MPRKPRRRAPFGRVLVNYRIDAVLVNRMRTFIADEADEYGQPRYRSQTQFVEEAIVKNLPRTAAKHRST